MGKIYFLLVRIKIKNMELEIRRRESTGSGPGTYIETETLAKFELMDGAPVRGNVFCGIRIKITAAYLPISLIWQYFLVQAKYLH